jgi:hypothetical protein
MHAEVSLKNTPRAWAGCILFGNDRIDRSDEATIEKLKIRAESKDIFVNRV